MNIDINEVLANMLLAVKDSVGEDWKLMKQNLSSFLDARKSRLELLASLRLENEIDHEFFMKRLKDEEKILESEMHAIAIVTKATAQRAANAALDVFFEAVKALIPG